LKEIIKEMLDRVGLLGFSQRTLALLRNSSIKEQSFQDNKVKAIGDMVTSLALFVVLAKLASTYVPFLYELKTIKVVDEIALGIYLLAQTFVVSVVLMLSLSVVLLPKGIKFHSLIFYHNFRVKALINIPFFVLFSIMLGKTFDGSGSLDFEFNDPRLYVALACIALMAFILIKLLFLPLKSYLEEFYGRKVSILMTCICILCAFLANGYFSFGHTNKLIIKEEACKAIFEMNKKNGNVPNNLDSSCFLGKCISEFDK
jgi:hypothetical protein